VRVLDEAFLRELRALTRERRVVLIFDEVQCGLGRTGWRYAHERMGIGPDIMTLAKPLAAGLPIGAALLSDEIAAAACPGDHATTFGGGPFVASVALHVAERLTSDELLAGVRERGDWLGRALGDLAARHSGVRAVRGIGYMWGIDIRQPARDVVSRALARGLLVCSAGDYTIRVLPPLVATVPDLERGIAVLRESLG
jgi:acetylornithine/N-succinyldiaminopimelate aminotransferase